VNNDEKRKVKIGLSDYKGRDFRGLKKRKPFMYQESEL
jgi:hypothetical protein